MLCKNPYMSGVTPYGCGQCRPCRINLRRTWTFRMVLESLCHAESAFLTLTFDDDHLPQDGSVSVRDMQLWLKRFRKELPPGSLRVFYVGEYGDVSQRPHYHAALFGVGRSVEDLVRKTWGMGHIMLGDLTLHSAQYIAGYVLKKMTKPDDSRLNGRHPEFARQSRRPGIGAPAIPLLCASLESRIGWDEIDLTGDVPRALRFDGKSRPLGRYLRSKLRQGMNFEVSTTPDEVLHAWSQEMSLLFSDSLLDPSNSSKSLKQILLDLNAQKRLNSDARFRIFNDKVGSL